MATKADKNPPFHLLLLGGLASISLGAIVFTLLVSPETAPWLNETSSLIGTGGAVILFMIALGALRQSRRNQISLSEFEEASRRVINRNYTGRISLDSRNHLNTIAFAFNELMDQLDESVQTRQSLSELDNLILTGADIEAIIRRALNAANLDALDIRLLLREDSSSVQVVVHKLYGQRVDTKVANQLNSSNGSLDTVDRYRELAIDLCNQENSNMLECHPVVCEKRVTGVLFASGHRTLTAIESKRLSDLVDRLSVAFTNLTRSETLYAQAHFDALTGLVNRRAFEDRLRESLSRSLRDETGVLLFLDLDGFKKVNDTEGHEAGDRLLVIVADRLREATRPEDTTARLGGDEFAVIASGCADEESIAALCERIISSITQPVRVDRLEHAIGVSIGVARFPEDGSNLEEIVMKADSAMYSAKGKGGSRFDFFDDSLKEASDHRVLVETRLRSAIKRNELELQFQPKLNVESWTVDSAEALLRWKDEKLGNVSPEMFVGIAEATGLIHEIMPFIVDSTTELLASAEANGVVIDSIALNASPKQIMKEGFALSILSMLDYRNTPHEKIEIEVTENVFTQDMAQVLTELHILRMAGIRVALDDFGTGYSSLNMLRELPLDVVKIDRTFITELETSDQARSMIKHLIDLAGSLGLKVVAEGVETDLQLQQLVDNNCDYIQGWIIARALPAREFLKTVKEWQSPQSKLQDIRREAVQPSRRRSARR